MRVFSLFADADIIFTKVVKANLWKLKLKLSNWRRKSVPMAVPTNSCTHIPSFQNSHHPTSRHPLAKKSPKWSYRTPAGRKSEVEEQVWSLYLELQILSNPRGRFLRIAEYLTECELCNLYIRGFWSSDRALTILKFATPPGPPPATHINIQPSHPPPPLNHHPQLDTLS